MGGGGGGGGGTEEEREREELPMGRWALPAGPPLRRKSQRSNYGVENFTSDFRAFPHDAKIKAPLRTPHPPRDDGDYSDVGGDQVGKNGQSLSIPRSPNM